MSASAAASSLTVVPRDRDAVGIAAKARRLAFFLLATLVVLLVHGYHPYAEDAAIYLPAIEKQLDPTLFPKGASIFLANAHFSAFSYLIAASVRITHLPLTYVLLLWYASSTALLLYASWRFAQLCFGTPRAGLYGTLLVTAVMTIPVAGTSLLLSDPYLTARTLYSPILLLALCFVLEHQWLPAFASLLFAFVLHPLLGIYGCTFAATMWAVEKSRWRLLAVMAAAIAVSVGAAAGYVVRTGLPASYRIAVLTRPYLFLSRWAWYEVFGLIAPLGLFAWLYRSQAAARHERLRTCSLAAVLNGTCFLVVAVAVTWSVRFIGLVRFQPLRAFYLIYLLLFLLPVNYAAQRIFRTKQVLFYILIAAVAAGMFFLQQQEFPASPHGEWPWIQQAGNPWRDAFDWIRSNTPKDATFALDPNYMDQPAEDRLGFRAYAERASLADRCKDGGIAVLFPAMADKWLAQSLEAETLLRTTTNHPQSMPADGKLWLVLRSGSSGRLACPYRNRAVAVCRINPTP